MKEARDMRDMRDSRGDMRDSRSDMRDSRGDMRDSREMNGNTAQEVTSITDLQTMLSRFWDAHSRQFKGIQSQSPSFSAHKKSVTLGASWRLGVYFV